MIIQIWYSRDGSILNDGNMVPKTVTSDGFVNVKSESAYKYFLDNAEINIYDTKNNLLDSFEVDLSPSKGIQTFGTGDYDQSYIKGSNPTTSSNSGSSGSKHIDVTTSDSFYFYSTESLAADEGYYAAVVVDGTPYYLDDHEYDELCHYSNIFASGFINQFQDTSTTQDVKMGHTTVVTIETPGNPVGDFELNVDKEFSFDYKIGTVGLNKQAHIITNLDLDD